MALNNLLRGEINIQAKDRIIVALDVSDIKKAGKLVEKLLPHVGMFKIGLEFVFHSFLVLLASKSNDSAYALRDRRQFFRIFDEVSKNKHCIFMDTKFHDIPNTIVAVAEQISQFGIKMFNVHCLSGSKAMFDTKAKIDQMVNEGVIKASNRPLVIGVTMLTSLSYIDLVEMGIYDEANISDTEELQLMEKRCIESF